VTAPARISQAEKPFTVPTLAGRWECSEGLIRKMIERGELRSFRIGALIRIPADEVERIECQSLTPSSDSAADTPSFSNARESASDEHSMPKIGRARKPRHADYGAPAATVIHGRWGD
jgi:excisionase family DNA binding protein